MMRNLLPLKEGASTRSAAYRRVLIVGGDTQVGLWVLRSLARSGLEVFCTCTNDHGLAGHSRYCSGAWVSEASAARSCLAGEIEDLAQMIGVGSIMTVAESYHRSLIQHRDRFEPDIYLFSPPAEVFTKATDKNYLHILCSRLGIPVALGMTLDNLMTDLGGKALRYPLVLRTRNQNANEGKAPWKAAYVENAEVLGRLFEQVRPIASNILVQEYHPGVEDHVQVLMHGGEAFMVGEYIGEHHMPLAGGVTVQRVTCRHENVINDAVRLLKVIGWEGVAGVQFHYDLETGKYIFLEINPRFIGGLPTVIRAGFDAPFLLWQSHFEPEKMKRTPYRLGMRTRILGGDANWMLGMIRGDPLPPGQKRLSKASAVGRFIWNFGPGTHDDTFWWRDPQPFWVDLKSMARKLRKRSVDLIGNPESP
jgi:predicted ATP-grasp superfamily ATP-dependent carboligase